VQSQVREQQSIEKIGVLTIIDDITCIESIERYGEKVEEEITKDFLVSCGDILELGVPSKQIPRLETHSAFLVLGLGGQFYVKSGEKEREFVEVVLDESSPLVGQDIATTKTFKVYEGAIVGYRPRKAGHPDYKTGDMLVMETSPGFASRQKKTQEEGGGDFLSVKKIGGDTKHEIDTVKAYTSGSILAVMLVCVAFSIFPLFDCALGAIVGMAVTGCASVADMKKGVSLKVVLTIVGAFGLGNAIGKHGVAEALGEAIVTIFHPLGNAGLLVAIAIAVVLLGIIFHGTAVVALMFPLCVHVAHSSGIPLHQMIAVLCYSVACQMLSPVSYNTNLMAFAACPEYQFTDFTKLGAPLVLIVLFVGIPFSMWWFE
jgi:hypothetical protein